MRKEDFLLYQKIKEIDGLYLIDRYMDKLLDGDESAMEYLRGLVNGMIIGGKFTGEEGAIAIEQVIWLDEWESHYAEFKGAC